MPSNPLLVSAGLAIATNLLSGIGGTVPRFIGHGTGTTPPAAGDTGLQTPSADSRATGTVSRITTTITNDTVQVSGTVACGSTESITECALFDAVSSGNLFARATFSVLSFISGDTVTYTWKAVLSAL